MLIVLIFILLKSYFIPVFCQKKVESLYAYNIYSLFCIKLESYRTFQYDNKIFLVYTNTNIILFKDGTYNDSCSKLHVELYKNLLC